MSVLLLIGAAITGTAQSICHGNEGCTSPGLSDSDCYAGSAIEPCTCGDGLEAKATGGSVLYLGTRYYHYECCDRGTRNAVSDGTCGDFKTDIDGCTQQKCSSFRGNCWAGTEKEGCFCEDGWTAVETGETGSFWDSQVYYEYTCCPRGGTIDGTCGAYIPSAGHSDEYGQQPSSPGHSPHGFSIVNIVIVAVVVAVAIGTAAYFCNQKRERRILASQLVDMARMSAPMVNNTINNGESG